MLTAPVTEAPNPEIMTDVLQQAAEIWCTEISEVVQTFLSDTQNDRITRIVVSGGGSYIQPLGTDWKAK